MPVYLTLAFIAVLAAGSSAGSPWGDMAMAFVEKFA
jgi:hypothetical protein